MKLSYRKILFPLLLLFTKSRNQVTVISLYIYLAQQRHLLWEYSVNLNVTGNMGGIGQNSSKTKCAWLHLFSFNLEPYLKRQQRWQCLSNGYIVNILKPYNFQSKKVNWIGWIRKDSGSLKIWRNSIQNTK